MTSKFDYSDSDYVEVAKRIDAFRAKHPEGTLQVRIVELPEAFADKFIAVEAAAFRNMDDTRPGIELAWEPVPGATPFTENSELQNAATSAIGRALIAVGAASSKGASFEEVRNRRAENTSLAGEGDLSLPRETAPAKSSGVSASTSPTEPPSFAAEAPDFTFKKGTYAGQLCSAAAQSNPKEFALYMSAALKGSRIAEENQPAAQHWLNWAEAQ